MEQTVEQGRIIVPAGLCLGSCYHIRVSTDGSGKPMLLENCPKRAKLRFDPLQWHQNIKHIVVSMLEIDLEYDVHCRRVQFHTIKGGDITRWGEAIQHIGCTLIDMKIGQFRQSTTRRLQLPDNWGDVKDHLSLPVVVWVKPVHATRHLQQHCLPPTAVQRPQPDTSFSVWKLLL